MDSGFFVDPVSYDLSAFIFRLAIGLALLPYPIQKYMNREVAPKKFPGILFFSPEMGFYIAMVVEFGASISLISGFLTRLIAIPAIINMGVATNYDLAEQKYKTWTATAAPYFLGLLGILIVGPGKYSLDWLIFG